MASRTSSSQMWDNSERPRSRGNDHPRGERGGDRRDRANPSEARGGRGAPQDGRNRSRSPRRERGGKRSENNRYRSRSPFRRKERDRDGGGREDRDENRHRGREAPKGPRGGGGREGGNYRDRDRKPPVERDSKAGGPVKPSAPSKPDTNNILKQEIADIKMVDEERPPEIDEETWEMMKVMGFGRFKSTKNTKVPGNDKNFGVRKDKVMEARQYMNRQGGFNRPLSPSRM